VIGNWRCGTYAELTALNAAAILPPLRPKAALSLRGQGKTVILASKAPGARFLMPPMEFS
jgi:hypothetical protein